MEHVNTVFYYLLDPKYLDKKIAIISIPLNQTFNTITEYPFYDVETGKELQQQ